MILGTFTQQPAETLDYDIDFTDRLAGDTIASATATISPTGPTMLAPMVISAGAKTKHWISDCTGGVTYKIEVTATTNGGRVIQAEFKIKCKDV